MNLQEHFNIDPPEHIVKEFPLGSNIKYIPIREIKKMLNEDFVKWETSDFKVQCIQHGYDFVFIGSVELTVFTESETYSFIGTNTFNTKTEQPEGNNGNYSAILLSNCIKNASKNFGKKYGFDLNTVDEYLPNFDNQKVQHKKPSIKKTINTVINLKK